MCSECDWSDDKGIDHQIRQKCDCGNFKWQWTSLKEEFLDLPSNRNSIYRCTKCDTLRLAQHLLHPEKL